MKHRLHGHVEIGREMYWPVALLSTRRGTIRASTAGLPALTASTARLAYGMPVRSVQCPQYWFNSTAVGLRSIASQREPASGSSSMTSLEPVPPMVEGRQLGGVIAPLDRKTTKEQG